MRDWNGQCHRCGKKTTVHIMSMFNEEEICLDCEESERQNPRYQEAVAADEAAVRSGNPRFQGIGI